MRHKIKNPKTKNVYTSAQNISFPCVKYSSNSHVAQCCNLFCVCQSDLAVLKIISTIVDWSFWWLVERQLELWREMNCRYFTIECLFDFVLDCLSGIKRMRTGECENVCLNESECLFVTKLVNWMVNECKKVNAKMFNAVNETAVWINKNQNGKRFCFY